MLTVERMIATAAKRAKVDPKALTGCVQACFQCAAACRACADACLGEPQIDALRRCIGLNVDCADLCVATGNMVLRTNEPDFALLRATVEACALACRSCGAECRKHASKHEHCRACADECDACERACRAFLQALGGTVAAS
jgi:hypothetical protein